MEKLDSDLVTPEDIFNIYVSGGRNALIKKMCTYPKECDHINKTVEKIIDYWIESFIGKIPVEKMIEETERLNEIMYEQICDFALDKLNESNTEERKSIVFEALSDINTTKEKFDKSR